MISRIMTGERKIHGSRRGFLKAGLALGAVGLGTLAPGGRAALGQVGAHVHHMPELGITRLPDVPAMDAPLVEPEVRRSANGVLGTSLRCALAYRDIGGFRLYLRCYEGGLAPTLRMKPGETNLNRVVVTMPKTVLLDSQHLRNVCSRVLFAANACPPETVYGHARAETPLLDQPLEGPVYLRSSDRRLPDLVAKLDGQIDIEVSAHISSVKGGLRATFAGIPDAPISKFTLDLQGGAKGVLENSDGVCSRKSRAKVRMVGQNNVRDDRRTRLRAACGKATHRAARKHHG